MPPKPEIDGYAPGLICPVCHDVGNCDHVKGSRKGYRCDTCGTEFRIGKARSGTTSRTRKKVTSTKRRY